MAYDQPPFRRHEADPSGPLNMAEQSHFPADPGFRRETDFGSTSTYQTRIYPGGGRHAEAARGPAVSATELDEVFDDPSDGDPGSDRMAVHLVWEAVLLAGVALLAVLLLRVDSEALTGDGLSRVLVLAAAFGLLGLGAGVSLRAGVPNLAIGPVAVAAGVYFADRGYEGVAVPAAFSVAAAALLGLALALVVVVFHVPGWAVSLAAALGVIVWLQQQQPALVPLSGGYDPKRQATVVFGVVAAIGVVGGLLGAVRPIRRSIGRFRPVADPARRRGVLAAVAVVGAVVLSTAFAAVAGILLAGAEGVPVATNPGLHLTALGLGVALVGGTSAFGRRGGVFGTMFAAVLLVLFVEYQRVQDWRISIFAIAAVVLVAGLVVTRAVETFGRPHPTEADVAGAGGGWEGIGATAGSPSATRNFGPAPGSSLPGAEAANTGQMPAVAPAQTGTWSAPASDSWSSALPAQPAGGRTDPWEDGRWRQR